MRRIPTAIAAASVLAAAAVAVPASASATEVQIGQTSSPIVAPTCPAGTSAQDCKILLTEETAIQSVSDGTSNPDVITQSGVLYQYTVGISSAAKAYATSTKTSTGLNETYGGPPEIELTVLRPVGTGKVKRYEVAANSALTDITDFQGDVMEIPLTTELPVVKGEIVALTTPTWAPVLSIDMDTTTFNYVQSRTANCSGSVATNYFNPQVSLGEIASYGCAFPGNRVEYSSAELTTPTAAAAIRLARRNSDRHVRVKILKRG